MKRLILIAVILLLSSSTVLAQDFCNGDHDFDGDCDATDVASFLVDFGRSPFNNPCPPDGPAPVAKTGMQSSFNPGDDGDLRRGVAWPNPRFTNNGDGTITDNLTGLIWLRDANCSLFNAPRTWYDTLDLIVPQLADGHCQLADGSSPGDWRLPNRFELESLIDISNFNPVLPDGHPFARVQSSRYWSSTTIPFNPSNAWVVHMYDGYVYMDPKSGDSHYVWPVRGGH
jgi:hypothetical protein